MIKDSKLIGTKIAAPFGWKKFKVGELFDMHSPSGNGLYSSADGIKFDKDDFVRCTTSSRDCNGVPICLPRSSFGEILERGLSVASNGDAGSVFYHNNEFAVLQDSYALTLKSDSDKISDFTYLFLCAVLNKQFELFSYTTKAVWKRYNMLEIELPVTFDNQLDFDWMSVYIKAVKADYLEQKALSNQNEIKAYLSAGNVDSMDVTDADRQFLRDFANLPRRKFKVTDILTLKNSPDIHVKQKTVPLISAGDNNHGIKERIQTFEYCNNVLTVSKLGQTFYYHSNVCYTDDVLGLQLPVDSILVGLFLQAILNKQTRQLSSYGHQFRMKRLSELSLTMPISNGDQIDVQSIEKYMQIQSKPLINNIVKTLIPVGGGQP